MAKLLYKQKERLIAALCDYTASQFSEMTREKWGVVQAYAGVIVQSISDLGDKNQNHKLTAQAYFKSPLFLVHCEALAIEEDLMMYIVQSPSKYLKKIEQFEPVEEEDNESY